MSATIEPTFRRVLRNALLIWLAAFGIYLLTAQLLGGTGPSEFSYYDRLAAAFLEGDLAFESSQKHDLTYYQGDWYLPFPPLPALLLLPWIAFVQSPPLDTVLFSLLLGATNVMLSYQVLITLARRGYSPLGQHGNLWLTLLFALGSVHWMMVIQGTVWFLAQVAAYTFFALALLIALQRRHPLWSGAALGLAMLARPHLALAAPVFLVLQWRQSGAAWPSFLRRSAWFGLPLLLTVVGLLLYNAARFDDPLDFGYRTQNVADELEADLAQYGQFDLSFVPRNARALLWALPAYDAELGGWWPDRWGMSLLLTSPALLLLGAARPAGERRPLFWSAVAATLLLLIPLLTYYNTGWWQFGYRFALDFWLLLLLLLAAGSRGDVPTRLFKLLVAVSIAINLWGTIWFAIIT